MPNASEQSKTPIRLAAIALLAALSCPIAHAQERHPLSPLPEPQVGDDGPAMAYVRDARHALDAHRTGEALEAMERAETRLADRSTPLFRTNEPSYDPVVMALHQARVDLLHGDYDRARGDLERAVDFSRAKRQWRAREVWRPDPALEE